MKSATYTPEEFEYLVKTRNPLALSYFYDNYAPVINGIIIRLYPSSCNQEDVFKKSFLHIWDKAQQYDPNRGSVFSWMSIILRAYTKQELKSLEIDPLVMDEKNIQDLSYGYTRPQLHHLIPLPVGNRLIERS